MKANRALPVYYDTAFRVPEVITFQAVVNINVDVQSCFGKPLSGPGGKISSTVYSYGLWESGCLWGNRGS